MSFSLFICPIYSILLLILIYAAVQIGVRLGVLKQFLPPAIQRLLDAWNPFADGYALVPFYFSFQIPLPYKSKATLNLNVDKKWATSLELQFDKRSTKKLLG